MYAKKQNKVHQLAGVCLNFCIMYACFEDYLFRLWNTKSGALKREYLVSLKLNFPINLMIFNVLLFEGTPESFDECGFPRYQSCEVNKQGSANLQITVLTVLKTDFLR